jgi:hypothetical protein
MRRLVRGSLDASLICHRRHLGLDPLDRPRPHPELCGDVQDTPVPLDQRFPDALLDPGGDLGPAEGLTIGAGTLEPSVDAADDHRPLELGEDPAVPTKYYIRQY